MARVTLLCFILLFISGITYANNTVSPQHCDRLLHQYAIAKNNNHIGNAQSLLQHIRVECINKSPPIQAVRYTHTGSKARTHHRPKHKAVTVTRHKGKHVSPHHYVHHRVKAYKSKRKGKKSSYHYKHKHMSHHHKNHHKRH